MNDSLLTNVKVTNWNIEKEKWTTTVNHNEDLLTVYSLVRKIFLVGVDYLRKKIFLTKSIIALEMRRQIIYI